MNQDQRLRLAERVVFSRRTGRSGVLAALCGVLVAALGGTTGWAEEKPIDLNADHLDIDQEKRLVTAKGNVRIFQTGVVDLNADEASYAIDKREIQATGNIRLVRNGDLFTSEKVKLNIENRLGTLENVVADLNGPGGRIKAGNVEFQSQDRYVLQRASYTNCDCEPDAKPAWELTANQIDMDRLENTLTAQNVRLRVADVPILWVPWWQHPLLPKRQSGLLYPTMRAAGGNGFEVDMPYYWNIAPQRDATFTLHPTSRRGVLTKMQYRYMGERYKGSLDTQNILDTVEDRHRGLTLAQHQHSLGTWDVNGRLAASQTRDFLNDFQQKKLVDSRERRLESRLTADRLWMRSSGYTNLQTGSLWYQNLDASNDQFTVQRLPYLNVTDNRPLHGLQRMIEGGGEGAGQFHLQSDAKFDSFYQQSGDAAQRVDLAPEIQYWRSVPIGHVSGAVGVRETAYLIQGDPNQTGYAKESSERRESASVRLRMDLDLARNYGDGAYKHTLEPVIQYANVSATQQSGLPNFDATLRHFSVTNLYDGNLYSGDDRVSAAQWVSYGVTSRLVGRQENGTIQNIGSFSIGQRWAPQGDREYWGGQPHSDVVSGLEWYLSDHWGVSLSGRYDPYMAQLQSTESVIGYQDAKTEINLGYNRNLPEPIGGVITEGTGEPVEDISLLAKVRLNNQWLLQQTSAYSLETQDLKSWRTGLTYEESCWSLELSGGRDLSSQTAEHGGGYIGFFFTLRGLGDYGVTS